MLCPYNKKRRYTTITLGEKIAELRQKNNLTQKDLASQLHISDKAVSRWETGRSLPDVEMMKPLAASLGVTVGQLYDTFDEQSADNDQQNYERIWTYYDHERVWHYKRNTIIAIALALFSTVFFMVDMALFVSVDVKLWVDYVLLVLALALDLSSILVEVLSAVHLHDFSKIKFHKLLYQTTLKVMLITYLSCMTIFAAVKVLAAVLA